MGVASSRSTHRSTFDVTHAPLRQSAERPVLNTGDVGSSPTRSTPLVKVTSRSPKPRVQGSIPWGGAPTLGLGPYALCKRVADG